MDPGGWLAFAMASLLIAILPGPGVANIVGHALNSGRKTAFAAIAGAVAGNVSTLLVSLAGVGTLVQAFPRAFRSIELAGAAWLVVVGLIGLARSRDADTFSHTGPRAISPGAAFAGSIAVSGLNPKSIVFFVAFVPQFIAGDKGYALQAGVLIATFASVVAMSDAAYALLALRVAGLLRSRSLRVWVRRAGGIVLIVTGLVAAAAGAIP